MDEFRDIFETQGDKSLLLSDVKGDKHCKE